MQSEMLKKFMKKNIPEINSGDTVRVHLKIKEGDKERIQIFEGLVIATHAGKSLNGTFTVRKESFGVGVERVFPIHSPRILKIERVKQSRVRRSKLYFMRNLSGKEARLKEINRDSKVWEEPEAEKELEKKADQALKSHGDEKSGTEGIEDKGKKEEDQSAEEK